MFVVADEESYANVRPGRGGVTKKPYFIELYSKFSKKKDHFLKDMQKFKVGWVWEIGITSSDRQVLDALKNDLKEESTPNGMLDEEKFLDWFLERKFLSVKDFEKHFEIGRALSKCVKSFDRKDLAIQAWVQEFERCDHVYISKSGKTFYYIGDSLVNVYNQVGAGAYFAGLTGELVARHIGSAKQPDSTERYAEYVGGMTKALYENSLGKARERVRKGELNIAQILAKILPYRPPRNGKPGVPRPNFEPITQEPKPGQQGSSSSSS